MSKFLDNLNNWIVFSVVDGPIAKLENMTKIRLKVPCLIIQLFHHNPDYHGYCDVEAKGVFAIELTGRCSEKKTKPLVENIKNHCFDVYLKSNIIDIVEFGIVVMQSRTH